MCGITGVAAFRGGLAPEAALIKAMCSTLVHRGPDDEGIEVVDGVGLGMRRLAVIDLAGGRQPIENEDGTVATVFNGEIYNFRELRRDLENRGHRFRTNSDTEVIVHAYEEYGDGFPEKLNGMFAIALHDRSRRRLVLVRDHLGIKPLYYSIGADYLAWGSEVKAVLRSGLADRELDMTALAEFLAWEYVPDTGTLHRGIRKLRPGEMMMVDLERGIASTRTFWDLPTDPEDSKMGVAEWEEAVAGKVDECVRRQLVSDVPLGAFLSGGVDSSLVVSAIPDARTYSIAFEDASYDESAYARRVAQHLGLTHSSESIDPNVVDYFDRLMNFMDDPIGDFSIFPTFLVSRSARRHVTVALSGDGGDELFGGYETYAANQLARWYARIPAPLRDSLVTPAVGRLRPRPQKKGLVNKLKRFVEGAAMSPEIGHARWRMFQTERDLDGLFQPEARSRVDRPIEDHIIRLRKGAGALDAVNRDLYVDTKSYLTDNCLVKSDRMSMAVSLEMRVPLLDRELAELAFRMPGKYKVTPWSTKALLKRVAARRVPGDCVYRPKQGFSIPIKQWLSGQFRGIMEELLNPRALDSQGIISGKAVERLKQEHLAGFANHSHILWSLIVFRAWQERWHHG